MSDYHAHPALNFSSLRLAAKSLLHYDHAKRNPKPPTAAMRLGSITHAVILDAMRPPEGIASEQGMVIWEGAKRGKAWSAFKAANEGKLIATLADFARAAEMRRAVDAHPVASALLRAPTVAYEVPIFWERGGVALRSRVDGYDKARCLLIEVKTTTHVEPRAFGRECAARLYHAQAGFYAHAIEDACGPWPTVKIVAIENVPPHDVAVYTVPDDVLIQGMRMCDEWIRAVTDAQRTGVYPGVCPGEMVLQFPEWAIGGDDPILPADPGAGESLTDDEEDEGY